MDVRAARPGATPGWDPRRLRRLPPSAPTGARSALRTRGWDYEGRLTEIFDGFTILKQNRSICLGTRIRERDGSWMTFKRDGVDMTAPVVSHWTGTTTTDITPGIGQKVGSTKTYNHNGLKNAEAQSQSASALSSTRVYDAWGAVVSSTGTHTGRFGHGGAYVYQSDSNNPQLLGHRGLEKRMRTISHSKHVFH